MQAKVSGGLNAVCSLGQRPRCGKAALYAEGYIFALARFWEREAFVCVISTAAEDKTIRLPMGAIGVAKPCEKTDLFDRPVVFAQRDDHSIAMEVKAHQSYLFRCDIP